MIAASKSEFLARHRTFHSRHKQVTDPLFAVDGFFDPRDLLLVKYEMLRRVRVDCWSVARATRGVASPVPRGTTRCIAGSGVG